tara:strand:- start:47117 stop:48262 length:1146 start_codon:yes stop_codon:yes gene_type:complete
LARLSFISHPFETLLKQAQSVTPGLERTVAMYYDNVSRAVKVVECFENGALSPLNYDLSIVQKERKKVKPTDWIRKNDMPFIVKEDGYEQLSISDEMKNNVLVMRFNNSYDGKSDVVFLYFNDNFGNFRLSKSDDTLTASAKNIIQSLLYKSWEAQITQMNNDYLIWTTLQKAEQLQKTSESSTAKENEQLKKRLFINTRNTVRYLLKKLHPSGEKISIPDKAIEKIMHLNLPVEHLDKLMEQALILAENKSVSLSDITITENEILPELLQFSEEKSLAENQEEEVEIRYRNTKRFLDRYEQAAALLKKQNKPITGANIGEACTPSISHAAISDVLKKHRNKIISLLQKYPDKWTVLRTEFRPVKNLLPAQTHNDNLGQVG